MIDKMCRNPQIKPTQKENQTLRHRLWKLIKECEIPCEKSERKFEKKTSFS